ncbi:MAG: prenyltransferase, partial [Candidatus Krumholzibacteria bacterium]|nr:prenyltransferase [Candidatus Krumholzibacteria bacterium]
MGKADASSIRLSYYMLQQDPLLFTRNAAPLIFWQKKSVTGHPGSKRKDSLVPRINIWFKEFRAEFLTASVIPVLLATAVARHETGLFDTFLFVMTLAGVVFLHLGTNIANDFFDHLSGNDILNTQYVRPFTGGSRLIQDGLITPRAVIMTSIAFFAAAVIVGIVLTMIRGPVILLFGLAGIVSGYFYTAPPLRFANRGLGETIVGVNFGLLIVMGTYYVQTGSISGGCIVASLPLTFLVASVILINEFQDSTADALAGKRTLVV